MDHDIRHHYRAARAHQMATYGSDNVFVDGIDQRQFTGGGAPHQEHALSALRSARQRINFRQRLRAMVS